MSSGPMDTRFAMFANCRQTRGLDKLPSEVMLMILEYVCGDVLVSPAPFGNQEHADLKTPPSSVWSPCELNRFGYKPTMTAKFEPTEASKLDPLIQYKIHGDYEVEDDTYPGQWIGKRYSADISSAQHTRRTTFLSLCLTSRWMRAHAQPFLYRAAVVRDNRLPYLARTLAAPNCGHLGQFVRVLCVLPSSPRRVRGWKDVNRGNPPTWRDPDILNMAAAYGKEPPADGDVENIIMKKLEFEAQLLAISAATVLKSATALERFRLLPTGPEMRIGALPGLCFTQEVSLSLARQPPDHDRIDRTLEYVIPRVRPPLRLHRDERNFGFSGVSRIRSYITGTSSGTVDFHDLLGVVTLVSAARDITALSCQGARYFSGNWFLPLRLANTAFTPPDPLALLTSLSLPECKLSLENLRRLLLRCKSLQHLKVHWTESFTLHPVHEGGLITPGRAIREVLSHVKKHKKTLKSLDIYIPTEIEDLMHRLHGTFPAPPANFNPVTLSHPKWRLTCTAMEYLDIPASAIWNRDGPENPDPDELKDIHLLSRALPWSLRTLAIRDISEVPVPQLLALADQCHKKGRFKHLKRLLLEGPRVMEVEWGGGDVEGGPGTTFDRDGNGGEGESMREAVLRGRQSVVDVEQRRWKREEEQREMLEKVEARFRARGVEFRITPGFLWDVEEEEEEEEEEDKDEDVEMEME